jgi:hypothetical protein
LPEREWNFGNVLPDRIAIYKGPIERDARTDDEIEEIVLDTVMHEIGHYFGMDDEALYAIEDEKERRKNGAPSCPFFWREVIDGLGEKGLEAQVHTVLSIKGFNIVLQNRIHFFDKKDSISLF